MEYKRLLTMLGIIVFLIGFAFISAGGFIQQTFFCSEFTINEVGGKICGDIPQKNATMLMSGSIISFFGILLIIIDNVLIKKRK